MKKTATAFLLGLITFLSACGGSYSPANNVAEEDTLTEILEGDSTIYGLACDGCTDTILVFLPLNNIQSDPDTFQVLDATRRHRVFGMPKIGDKIAVVRNAKDSTVADFVINLENILGTWCYMVKPSLRMRADMGGKSERQILTSMPDSVRDSLMVPHEYGISIKGDHTAQSIGIRYQASEDSPVEYPVAKRYHQWQLYNGLLLLTEIAIDSTGQMHTASTDTAQFLFMERDSLVLKFADHVQSFYRQKP